MIMDEQKQSHIIDDFLDADTDPALRSQRPSVRSRAVVPALREQRVPIPIQVEPKQGEIQQGFVPGSVQKQQGLHTRRPKKRMLIAAYALATILFLGLISF